MPVKRTKSTETTTAAKKTKAPRATKRRALPTVGPEEIAVRAYFIHLEGGGEAYENWLRAERELLAA